jgi:hypothetical protein
VGAGKMVVSEGILFLPDGRNGLPYLESRPGVIMTVIATLMMICSIEKICAAIRDKSLNYRQARWA